MSETFVKVSTALVVLISIGLCGLVVYFVLYKYIGLGTAVFGSLISLLVVFGVGVNYYEYATDLMIKRRDARLKKEREERNRLASQKTS